MLIVIRTNILFILLIALLLVSVSSMASAQEGLNDEGGLKAHEICLLVEPAELDTDNDIKDDACDGYINEPPTQPEDIGVVDTPKVINTTKELPVSESRPEWLIELERQIQANNDIANLQSQNNLAVNTQEPEPTSLTTQTTARQLPNNQQQEQPSQETTPTATLPPETSSATEVKAATSQANEPAENDTWRWAIGITFILLIISAPLFAIARIIKNK